MKSAKILLLIYCYIFPIFANSEELKLDHVIVAVDNVKQAISTYKKLGFSIKPGRLHKNGLLNAHIKFSNQTELELMSVVGDTTDSVANAYSDFLDSGEGGAYVALTGPSIDHAAELLKSLEIEHQVQSGRFWDYIVFPKGSDLEHFFFIKMHKVYPDKDWVYKHKNGASHISRVWIEGNQTVITFLQAFGARQCKEASAKAVGGEYIYQLANSNFILINPQPLERRSRFMGIAVSSEAGKLETIDNAHGVWIKQEDGKLCANDS